MDARDQRAIVIAALAKINRQDGAWLVPSQSAEKKYAVKLDGEGSCTCLDHTEGGQCCKHIRAVRIVLRRELGMDGTIIETREVLFQEKKTYKQDWSAYLAAQYVEKHRFQVLLHDLCQGAEEPPYRGNGRRPHSTRDAIFSMAYKVYSTFSSRRFTSDLVDAHERGYLSRRIHGNKVSAFLENPAFTPILHKLIAQSAKPLSAVETDFAVDSSGFSSSKFERWYDHKYGAERQKCVWVKAHVACGVKTNVVTSVRILDKDAADSPQFGPLVKSTRENFTINEVSADKAYLSNENFETVADCGGTAFIPFKANSTGGKGGLFEKMFGYFQYRKEEFLAHYHKRSNIEACFSMMKRKFGDAVRSKTDTAMVNEVLCKILCHNLCCLIQEQHELGIDPVFWRDDAESAKPEFSGVADEPQVDSPVQSALCWQVSF
ncbi:MAG: transposase [Planctomycetes bacterium]|nr:transposase [Planctomycetota bacterium]